jgi:hypothetical protein
MMTNDLSSLKNTLVEKGKLTEAEYDEMYPHVAELVNDLSIKVFSYELGQIAAIFS